MLSWMIVGPQIRAARGLLGWTIDQLAEESGVRGWTIGRAEREEGIPGTRAEKLMKIQQALEKGGIAFLDPSGGAGVRLRTGEE